MIKNDNDYCYDLFWQPQPDEKLENRKFIVKNSVAILCQPMA
jgi:hypothetical protein